MKNALVLAVIALTMFGLTAGGSWLLRERQMASQSAAAPQAAAGDDSSGGGDAAAQPSSVRPIGRVSALEPVPAPDAAPAPAGASPQRLAVEPIYTPGVEETVHLASSLRDRATAVRERETQLVARQKHLELVIEDIRSERAAIDALRQQLDEALKLGEERMAEMEQQRTQLDIRKQDIDNQVTEMSGAEKDNIKKMGSVYDNMAPESAAKILQQMADSGTMDTAVKLLAVMKERQAAKVLAEMPDPSLAAQLSERLKDLKRPATTKK